MKSRSPNSNLGRELVPAEKFVELWQTCQTLKELVEKTGYSDANTACHRASKFRRQGVPLKYYMQGNKQQQWFALAEQARALLKPEDVTFQDE